MTRACITLDFARTRPPINRRGLALLLLSVAATAVVLADFQSSWARREGLELRAAELQPAHVERKPDKAAERIAKESRAALADLAMPWSQLLQELELASAESKGSIAVLGVEPDREKRQVLVFAEARTLPSALQYVERLQRSQALRYPMLERHEVQVKDAQKPVRFQIRADWRASR